MSPTTRSYRGAHSDGRGRRPAGRAGRGLLAVVFAAVLLSACSTGAATSSTTPEAPQPAGVDPSPIAKMVCAPEATNLIDSALGETAMVSLPTWTDDLYSCQYQYATGYFTLSVKELSSWPETMDYFNSRAAVMGKARNLPNLGQGAFQTTDGSVVVRKDWKVLEVDIATLPSHFGAPPTSSGEVAITVADVILGCWDGD